jgi:hypothetical protein
MMPAPMAGESLEQNLNPVGRLYPAGSTMILRKEIAQDGAEILLVLDDKNALC